MRIYLIGYMGSGKSRFGSELAEITGYPFIDTDDLFEERYRISIVDFFDKYHEAFFRKIESNILRETVNFPDAVIATGGGTPCFFDNMDFIQKNGISIYLRMETDSLLKRLSLIKKKRPLLKDKSPGEMENYIRYQLAEREKFYLRADHIIEAEKYNVKEIFQLIPSLPQL